MSATEPTADRESEVPDENVMRERLAAYLQGHKKQKKEIKKLLVQADPAAAPDAAAKESVMDWLKRFADWAILIGFAILISVIGVAIIIFYFACQGQIEGTWLAVPYVIQGIVAVAAFFGSIIILAIIERELLIRKRTPREIACFDALLGMLYFSVLTLVYCLFGFFVAGVKTERDEALSSVAFSVQAMVACIAMFLLQLVYTHVRVRLVYDEADRTPLIVPSFFTALAFLAFLVSTVFHFAILYNGVSIFIKLHPVAYNVTFALYIAGMIMTLVATYKTPPIIFVGVSLFLVITTCCLALTEAFDYADVSYFIAVLVTALLLLLAPTEPRGNLLLTNLLSIGCFVVGIVYSCIVTYVLGDGVTLRSWVHKVILQYVALLAFVPAFLTHRSLFLPLGLIMSYLVGPTDVLVYCGPILIPILAFCIVVFDTREFVRKTMTYKEKKKEKEREKDGEGEREGEDGEVKKIVDPIVDDDAVAVVVVGASVEAALLKDGEEVVAEGDGKKIDPDAEEEEGEFEVVVDEEALAASKKRTKTIVTTCLRIYVFSCFLLCAIALIVRSRFSGDSTSYLISSIVSFVCLFFTGFIIEMWNQNVVFPIRIGPLWECIRRRLARHKKQAHLKIVDKDGKDVEVEGEDSEEKDGEKEKKKKKKKKKKREGASASGGGGGEGEGEGEGEKEEGEGEKEEEGGDKESIRLHVKKTIVDAEDGEGAEGEGTAATLYVKKELPPEKFYTWPEKGKAVNIFRGDLWMSFSLAVLILCCSQISEQGSEVGGIKYFTLSKIILIALASLLVLFLNVVFTIGVFYDWWTKSKKKKKGTEELDEGKPKELEDQEGEGEEEKKPDPKPKKKGKERPKKSKPKPKPKAVDVVEEGEEEEEGEGWVSTDDDDEQEIEEEELVVEVVDADVDVAIVKPKDDVELIDDVDDKKEADEEAKKKKEKPRLNTTYLKFAFMQCCLFGALIYFMFPLMLSNTALEGHEYDHVYVAAVFFVCYLFSFKFDQYSLNYSAFIKNKCCHSVFIQLDNIKMLRPMALLPIIGIYIIYIVKEVKEKFGVTNTFSFLHLFIIAIVLLEILSSKQDYKLINFLFGFTVFSPIFIAQVVKFYVNDLDYFESPELQIPLDIELTLFLVLGLCHSFFKLDIKKPIVSWRNALLENNWLFALIIIAIAVFASAFTTHYYIFFTFAFISIIVFLCFPSKKHDTKGTLMLKKVLLTLLPFFWCARITVDVCLAHFHKCNDEYYCAPYMVYLLLLFGGLIVWVILVNIPLLQRHFDIVPNSKFEPKEMLTRNGHNARFNFILIILKAFYVAFVVFALTFVIKGYIGFSFMLLWLVFITFVFGDFFYLLAFPVIFTAQLFFALYLHQVDLVMSAIDCMWISFTVASAVVFLLFLIGRLTNIFKYSTKHGSWTHYVVFEFYYLWAIALPVIVAAVKHEEFQFWPILPVFLLTVVRAIVNGTHSYYYFVCLGHGTVFLIFNVATGDSWLPVSIVMIVLSFVTLTFLQIADQATDKPKWRKYLDLVFMVACSIYLVVVPIIFCFMDNQAFWLFEVLYVFYSIWFSIVFATYILLFIFPITTGVFVYMLLKSAELYPTHFTRPGAKHVYWVSMGFVGAYFHALLYYVLSRTGILYGFKSNKARKILFYPAWYLFFGVPYINKANDSINRFIKKIEPYMLCKFITKKCEEKKKRLEDEKKELVEQARKEEESRKPKVLTISIDEVAEDEHEEIERQKAEDDAAAAEKAKVDEAEKAAEDEKQRLYRIAHRDELCRRLLVDGKDDDVTFESLRGLINCKTWWKYLFITLWNSIRASWYKNKFQTLMSTFFLLETMVLSFGTMSFGILPFISFAVLMAGCLAFRVIIPSMLLPPLTFFAILFNYLYFVLVYDVEALTGIKAPFWLMFPAGFGFLFPSAVFFFVVCFMDKIVVMDAKELEELEDEKRLEVERKALEVSKKVKVELLTSPESIRHEKTDVFMLKKEDTKADRFLKWLNLEVLEKADKKAGGKVKKCCATFRKLFALVMTSEAKSHKDRWYRILKAIFFMLNNTYLALGLFFIGFPIPFKNFEYSTVYLGIPLIVLGVLELFLGIFLKWHFVRVALAIFRIGCGVFSLAYVIPYANDYWSDKYLQFIIIPLAFIMAGIFFTVAVVYFVVKTCIAVARSKRRTRGPRGPIPVLSEEETLERLRMKLPPEFRDADAVTVRRLLAELTTKKPKKNKDGGKKGGKGKAPAADADVPALVEDPGDVSGAGDKIIPIQIQPMESDLKLPDVPEMPVVPDVPPSPDVESGSKDKKAIETGKSVTKDKKPDSGKSVVQETPGAKDKKESVIPGIHETAGAKDKKPDSGESVIPAIHETTPVVLVGTMDDPVIVDDSDSEEEEGGD